MGNQKTGADLAFFMPFGSQSSKVLRAIRNLSLRVLKKVAPSHFSSLIPFFAPKHKHHITRHHHLTFFGCLSCKASQTKRKTRYQYEAWIEWIIQRLNIQFCFIFSLTFWSSEQMLMRVCLSMFVQKRILNVVSFQKVLYFFESLRKAIDILISSEKSKVYDLIKSLQKQFRLFSLLRTNQRRINELEINVNM